MIAINKKTKVNDKCFILSNDSTGLVDIKRDLRGGPIYLYEDKRYEDLSYCESDIQFVFLMLLISRRNLITNNRNKNFI